MKVENIENSVPKSNNNFFEPSPSSSDKSHQGFDEPMLMKVKQENLSPRQSQIDTDESEHEKVIEQPELRKKSCIRKRASRSHSKCDEDQPSEKKTKINPCEASTSSRIFSELDNQPIREPSSENDRIAKEMKKLMETMPKDQSRNPNEFLGKLEKVIGRKRFSILRKLIIESFTTANPSKVEELNVNLQNNKSLMTEEEIETFTFHIEEMYNNDTYKESILNDLTIPVENLKNQQSVESKQNISNKMSLSEVVKNPEEVIDTIPTTSNNDNACTGDNLTMNTPFAKRMVNKLRLGKDSTSVASSSASKVIQSMEKTISNISYIKCRAEITMKCNAENCYYESINDQIFQFHLKKRHLTIKWNGFCNLCNKKIFDSGSLFDEYNHMHKVHILKDNAIPPKDSAISSSGSKENKSPSIATVPSASSNEQPETIEKYFIEPLPAKTSPVVNTIDSKKTPAFCVEPATAKPLTLHVSIKDKIESKSKQKVKDELNVSHIKLALHVIDKPKVDVNKKLKHNQISLTKVTSSPAQNETSLDQPTSSEQPHMTAIKSATSPKRGEGLTKSVTQNTPTLLESSRHEINSKYLKPWLYAEDLKDPFYVANMLKENCLVDLYKCMGKKCDFHSGDFESFNSHLKLHQQGLDQDWKNIGRCAYCSFSTNNFVKLINHIQTQHKFDRYACTKCFYRSISDFYVKSHGMYFHKDSSVILDCIADNYDFKQKHEEVLNSLFKVISTAVCFGKFILLLEGSKK